MVFCLFACHPHYPLWKELNAKQFVMKRNKLLRVKKFMIEREMLGVLNPLDTRKRISSDKGGLRTLWHWKTGSIEPCKTF